MVMEDKTGEKVMNEKLNPLYVFISAFGLSSFAGLAALLRAGEKVTPINIVSALLNSGLMGVGMAMLWFNRFQDNIYFLIGLCVLAGLGGATLVEFTVTAVKVVLMNYLGNPQNKDGDNDKESKK